MEGIPGSNDDMVLIPLRRELRLYPAAQEEGRPGWTLEDPVRNRFFRLGRHQVEQLARWDCGFAQRLCELLGQEAGLTLEADEVAQFQQFLLKNALLQPGHPAVENHLETRSRQKTSWWSRATHSYIFFRVPLWNPQRFLNKTLPYVRFLASPAAFVVYAILLLAALLLLTPQWGAFIDSFSYFISWQGAVIYLAVLFLVKFMHELGHAYTATAYGIKVPVIGVAFIVLWPMLYSDNTDAWREQRSSVRTKIVLAGITVEIVVAVLSTFLWTVLQPGVLRSLCFALATSSLLSSLLINISPFMRFDGYYLLSEVLGVPNMAPRAFALGRWRLRRLLWGFNIPKPEYFSSRMDRILTLYAYGTWLYRLILFTGIAFMVYHLFFKSLGIILFLIEIYVFIAKPVLTEITQWWKQRELIGCNGHVVTTLLVLVALFGALFVPFSSTLVVPAQLGAMEHHRVFVPFPAQLEQIHVQDGEEVQQGELLFTLASEHLDARSVIVKLQIEALEVQLQRELGVKHKIETTAVTQQRLTAALVEAQGLEKKRQQLQIRATLSGFVEQLPAGIQPGCWIGVAQMLCQVVSMPGEKISASIAEADLALLPKEIAGEFYANGGDIARVPCTMTFLDSSDQEVLEPAMLASIYGGDVAVVGHGEAALRPLQNRYRIEFVTNTAITSPTSMRGNVVLQGKALSLVSRCWRSLAPGLIRESQL